MAFTSKDNLHARMAPMFLRPRQRFGWEEDLKAALKRLNEHYVQFREEIEQVGPIGFAHEPPSEVPTIISDLWHSSLRLDGDEGDEGEGDDERSTPEPPADLLARIKLLRVLRAWRTALAMRNRTR